MEWAADKIEMSYLVQKLNLLKKHSETWKYLKMYTCIKQTKNFVQDDHLVGKSLLN